MSNWDALNFAPQGWQCPICKRVYSPMTTMCYYCGNGVQTTKTSTGNEHDKAIEGSLEDWTAGEESKFE